MGSGKFRHLNLNTTGDSAPRASQVLLVVKNLPANAGDMRDAGLILSQEDLLEEDMATYSSILGWKIPWTEEPGGLWWSTGLQSQTRLNN